ncbi:unnamed protein product [Boreogadus saida]
MGTVAGSSPATLRRTQGDPGKRSPSNRAKEKDKTGDSSCPRSRPGTSPLPAPTKPVPPVAVAKVPRGPGRGEVSSGGLRPPRRPPVPAAHGGLCVTRPVALHPPPDVRALGGTPRRGWPTFSWGHTHFRKQTLEPAPFPVAVRFNGDRVVP